MTNESVQIYVGGEGTIDVHKKQNVLCYKAAVVVKSKSIALKPFLIGY